MSRLGESEGNSYSRTWELNVYELNREPHELIDDDTEIAVSPKVLQNELMCPICLDILKVTMTTKECLHRFCQECIITALRAGNKECPTCRKKLVSKRSLRPDPNFDGIISKIYPNREEYDALQAQALEKLNRKRLTAAATASNSGGRTNGRSRSHNANAASSSSAAALANEHNNETVSSSSSFNHPRGSENRSHRRVAYVSDESGKSQLIKLVYQSYSMGFNFQEDEESRASTEQSSLHMQQEHDELEIILKPHPILETNLVSRRFLKTTSNATGKLFITLVNIFRLNWFNQK